MMAGDWTLQRGAILLPDGSARFSVWAPHAGLLALYRDLLTLRAGNRALRPDGSTLSVADDAAAGWITLHRVPVAGDPHAGGGEYLATFNFGGVERSVPLPEGGAGWRMCLSTDAAVYGGEDRAIAPANGRLALPGWVAALLQRESGAGSRGSGAP